ncbi:MAG: 1-acyl-sn-glycerol-3-phosphate acyltransferase [Moraxellaceae bacterium]|mgnify:CR=1 FL=1|nr:1-acyl-sn-glycerol-3-phosphate acyltransferase [Moraxellaceae bacterium]MBP7229181.1 1-acyl-sn-glycerol-3-phosphate acyltransferase [Moraxellaceae bacterium]MBP8851633.1 1-acyl-sn-glycerol-3-phosphate acyltransferase [Moraxellaceae bacterium]MBP9045117.1 1-acyl-sn-glycerol-3-phosphate acyltransferase [Moraxellaceae bacterium]MBP9729893.1 1-acyl-sn-glycerol-3-phosphate acyltransferase [Moraxellaceae bacterium]
MASIESASFKIRLRLYYRIVRLSLHLLAGAVLAVVCGAAFVQYRIYQQPLIRWWHRRFCEILNLDVRVHGEPLDQHAMWISNHVSWLDIPVLGAHFPVYFLSKAEVANWPVVGWLARAAGTLFIQRGSGEAGSVEIRLAGHLRAGRNILFFPEGTTTNGEKIKRFFHKLFGAAVKEEVPLQPVLVCYRDEHDDLHPHAPFIGDDLFMDHAIDILKGERMVVDVLVLPSVMPDGRDARKLARDMEAVMLEALGRLQRRDF